MADPAGNDPNLLLRHALAGDESALAVLFDGHRERLRRMIRLRLDRRLSGRVDASDVLQEAYLDARKRIAEYARDPAAMPFPLWLRLIAGQGVAEEKIRVVARRIHHRSAPLSRSGKPESLYTGAGDFS